VTDTLTDAPAFARRMWVRFETYHDVTYFTPEARAATDALGCKGGWMGYFGTRAAPMGAAAPEIVVSAFYNFHPSLVHRALPEAWHIASPEQFLATRLSGADAALRRMLGEDVVTGPDLAEAASLAMSAASATPTAGRPLAAANALLPWPAEPHLALWQAATLFRESRGDGHIAALIAADLDPCEALVMFGADRGPDPAYLRAARRWPEPEWQAATDRVAARGLLTATGELTAAGQECRRWVEDHTDQAAMAPWRAIGPDNASRLHALLTPIARALADHNDAMRTNPMALNAAKELA
jgi:hypothetical protein